MFTLQFLSPDGHTWVDACSVENGRTAILASMTASMEHGGVWSVVSPDGTRLCRSHS
jgi:predicted phage tail protein